MKLIEIKTKATESASTKHAMQHEATEYQRAILLLATFGTY